MKGEILGTHQGWLHLRLTDANGQMKNMLTAMKRVEVRVEPLRGGGPGFAAVYFTRREVIRQKVVTPYWF